MRRLETNVIHSVTPRFKAESQAADIIRPNNIRQIGNPFFRDAKLPMPIIKN